MMNEYEKSSIGKRLAHVATSQFKSKRQLAIALNVSPAALTEYFSGKTIPGRVMLDKLRSIGVNVDYVMYGEGKGNPILNDPPILYGVSAGYFSPVYEDLKDTFDTSWLHKPGVIVLKVNGNSMENIHIHNQDVIVVDTTLARNVGDVVIAKEGESMTVKRLTANGLKPENDLYETIPLSKAINVIGIVTHIIKKVK